MPKNIPDAQLDEMLDVIHNASNSSHITITAGAPTDYSDLVTKTLAGQALASATTIGPGDVDGRKATVQANLGVSISTSGDGDHVSLHNNSSTVYLTTTATTQALIGGGTVDIPSWSHTIRQLV